MELGVVPLVRLSESQEADDLESVKLIAPPVLLLTDRFWDEGDVPPCWKPNPSEDGVTTRALLVVEVILSVTGTVIDPAREESVIDAL